MCLYVEGGELHLSYGIRRARVQGGDLVALPASLDEVAA